MRGRITRRGFKGQARGPCAQKRPSDDECYSKLSGLEDVVFNDFIKDDFIPEGHGQVASDSASLPDPVALETLAEEQTLKSEQNERNVLEAPGEYKCDAGMSVENVSAVVQGPFGT
jgi:hypothetical protein